MKFINIILLQWFFIRLTECRCLVENEIGLTGKPEPFYHSWYSIQLFVIPLTGWISGFKYLGKPKFIRITKKERILK